MQQIRTPLTKEALLNVLLIDKSGVPAYTFPASEHEKTILVSGLLTAINNFANQISGNDISNMSFGNNTIIMSRLNSGYLLVTTFNSDVFRNMDRLKSVHIELRSLVELNTNGSGINGDNLGIQLDMFYRNLLKEIG